MGYRPGVQVDRMQGANGVLFMLIFVSGVAGLVFNFIPSAETSITKYRQIFIVLGGIATYIIFMIITKYGFHRIVTTELFLIVGWTMLELSILNRLSGSELLVGSRLVLMYCVIALAFAISMVLYVAYYRMDKMKAFYVAMVPLITEGLAMVILVFTSPDMVRLFGMLRTKSVEQRISGLPGRGMSRLRSLAE